MTETALQHAPIQNESRSMIWVLDEHLGFAHDICAMEASILSLAPRDMPRLRADATWWLRALLPRVQAHHRREEASPMFTELPVRHPAFAPTIERLREEHRTIERIGRDLMQIIGTAADAILVARLAGLLRLLRRHEADEDDVLLEAYFAEHLDAAE